MELKTPPFTLVSFQGRNVGIAWHTTFGLVLADPVKDNLVPQGLTRLYCAFENIVVLDECDRPLEGVSIHLAPIVVDAYAAYLNPSFLRPGKLDDHLSYGAYRIWPDSDEDESFPACDRCNGTGYQRTPFEADKGELCKYCGGEGVYKFP